MSSSAIAFLPSNTGFCSITPTPTSVLGEIDPTIWNLLYNAAFVKAPERNDPCCCGSGRKFKRCHEVAVNSLRLIGKENVEKDFKVLNLL